MATPTATPTATSPQITKDIDRFFYEALYAGASDLHLAAGLPPAFRIGTELVELHHYGALSPTTVETMAFSLLTPAQRDHFLKAREADLAYQLPDGPRFRINIHWEKGHVGLVARIIPLTIPTMQQLNLPEVVYHLADLHHGLVLVTGPTGCGKSTTLAAIVDYINAERAVHIVTLEDPIEFLHTSKKALVRQREYRSDFLSFAEALKHVVRQDPDVIMVGEMRDLETIAAAITVAETGHLVLATLHTISADQTIDRIVDIFPPYQQHQIRTQLALVLRGVISQQLLPKKNGGLIAAREIMVNTPAVANLIRENKAEQLKSVIQTNAEQGMRTLDQDIRALLEADVITKEVAESYMVHPETSHT